MAKTYMERPPATARTARQAWDYFAATHPSRSIRRIYYSPGRGEENGWIVDWDLKDVQVSTFAIYDPAYGTKFAPSREIADYFR